MTGKDIYKVWAPVGAKWVDWVRPVPFININDNTNISIINEFNIPTIFYEDKCQNDVAYIVDLPGIESINEGLALAKLGFRPIPVYNGTSPQKNVLATTDNDTVSMGLVLGSVALKGIDIKNDATPAFLVDSNRLNRRKMNESVFDNSWDLYHQDLPTADYFLKNGITKIIIRSKKVNKDLVKIFYKFKKKGINIYFADGLSKDIKLLNLRKPFGVDKDF